MPALERTWTILNLLETTTAYFSGHKVEPARLTAELLLAGALGLRRLDLYLRFDQPCSIKEREAFRELVKRRAKGEPTQYILGKAEFWSLPIKVDPRVLIPRADTEVLVEEALRFAKEAPREDFCILDLCTGSGCVALALQKELPAARVEAVDCEEGALAVAKENAEALKLPLFLLQGDLFAPLEAQKKFDLIVSNPPYIASAEIASLQPEVGVYEPKKALDGGADGLDIIRRIFASAATYLKEGGACMVELSPEQRERAEEIAQRAGFTTMIRNDYEQRARVLVAKR